jgi:hypothetical protein
MKIPAKDIPGRNETTSAADGTSLRWYSQTERGLP